MRYRFFKMMLCLLLSHSYTVLNAAEIAGHIVDAEGRSLENATVELVGSGRGGLSDRDGRFVLGELEPQRYLLCVSHLGYVAVLDSIDLRTRQRPHDLYSLHLIEHSAQHDVPFDARGGAQVNRVEHGNVAQVLSLIHI